MALCYPLSRIDASSAAACTPGLSGRYRAVFVANARVAVTEFGVRWVIAQTPPQPAVHTAGAAEGRQTPIKALCDAQVSTHSAIATAIALGRRDEIQGQVALTPHLPSRYDR